MGQEERVFHIVIVLGLTTALIVLGIHFGQTDDSKISPACDDAKPCTRDALLPDTTCEHKPYSTAHACNQCYTSGNCDGSGACTGSASACLGACNAGDPLCGNGGPCDNLFTWNADWLLDGSVLTHSTKCWADRCTAMASFQAANGVQPNAYYTSTLQCKDLMDAAWWAANGTCVDVERFVAGTEDTGTVDVHFCYYYWRCGAFNQTWLHIWEID